MRRATCLLLSVLAAAPLTACGSARTPAQQRRVTFLRQERRLADDQLARLCPSLFPTDFLAKPKKYGYTRSKKRVAFTAADRAAAARAGCGPRGTVPRP